MSDVTERRRFKRTPVKIEAAVYIKAKPSECVPAELLDLSLGGAFVNCSTPMRLGEELLIEIRFSEAVLFEARVVVANETASRAAVASLTEKVIVRWTRGSGQAGFGVEFVALTPKNKEFLAKLLHYFEDLKRSGVYLPNR